MAEEWRIKTNKRRTLKGIILSLLLHLLIFLLFFISLPKIKIPPPSGKSEKISLNLSQFKTPPPTPKPKVKQARAKPAPSVKPLIQKPFPRPIVKPAGKPKEIAEEKSVIKNKPLKDDTRTFVEVVEKKDHNVTKPEKLVKKVKDIKKDIKKEKVAKKEKSIKKLAKKKSKNQKIKKHTAKRKKQRKKSKNPLANALMDSGQPMYTTMYAPASSGSYSSKMIKQLYGKEFDSFSPTQKKFIKHNLGIIHRITQRTLTRNGYPEVSARTGQQGTNVVSFYLHPNGDISNLRLKARTEYSALDKNTLEVIRIAYKDYPLPNKKTKIVFYVQYSIY